MACGVMRVAGLSPYQTESIQPLWPRRPRLQPTAGAAPLSAADPDPIAGPGRRACVNFWTESLPGSTTPWRMNLGTVSHSTVRTLLAVAPEPEREGEAFRRMDGHRDLKRLARQIDVMAHNLQGR